MKSTVLTLCMLFLVSCATTQVPRIGIPTATSVSAVAAESQPLTVLSGVGGLCVVAGVILLVVTSGRKGWYACIAGIAMVILNFLVSKYDDFLFYPLIVCTGAISAAWTYKTVKQILQEKKQ